MVLQNILSNLNKWKYWLLIPAVCENAQNHGIDYSISDFGRLNNLYQDSVPLHTYLVSTASISTCSNTVTYIFRLNTYFCLLDFFQFFLFEFFFLFFLFDCFLQQFLFFDQFFSLYHSSLFFVLQMFLFVLVYIFVFLFELVLSCLYFRK